MGFLDKLFSKKKQDAQEAVEAVAQPTVPTEEETVPTVAEDEELIIEAADAESLDDDATVVETVEEIPTEEVRKKEKRSFWSRVKEGLSKTKNAIFGQIDDLLKNFVKVDEDLLEELEEILICADVGVNAAEEIIDELREQVKDGRLKEKEQVTDALRGILEGMIGEGEPLHLDTTQCAGDQPGQLRFGD